MIYNLEKLSSKELYHMQLCLKFDKPTCQSYHKKNFDDYDFNWKLIYRITRIATLETKICILQYELLNNLLYLNKKLFQFGIISQSRWFFCDLYVGFTDVLDNNFLLVIHLLFIFKYNIYNSWVNNSLSFQSLKCVVSQIKYIEETISNHDLNKKRKISNKWKLIDHLF